MVFSCLLFVCVLRLAVGSCGLLLACGLCGFGTAGFWFCGI